MKQIVTGKIEQEVLSKINAYKFDEFKLCMNGCEKEFLTPLFRIKRLQKYLELGSFFAVSSLDILNTHKNNGNGGKLYSIDTAETFADKKVGYIVDNFPEFKENWKLHKKARSYKVMKEVSRGGGGLDGIYNYFPIADIN